MVSLLPAETGPHASGLKVGEEESGRAHKGPRGLRLRNRCTNHISREAERGRFRYAMCLLGVATLLTLILIRVWP